MLLQVLIIVLMMKWTYPFIRQDCIDAFNYLASLPEIDSHKIIFWGESHGAFIADDITITCHKDLKYPPAGVVSFYAPIDLYDYFLYKEEHNEHVVVNGRENDGVTFGAEGDNLLKVLKQYSVLDKINGNEPPFFLMHGLKDECIPFKYTEEFDAALSEKGVPHILNFVQDGLHGIDFYADPIYNAPVIDFINRIFEGEEI